MSEGSALVVFSGGQDSTVCLAWALGRYDRVETIGFAYGTWAMAERLGGTPFVDLIVEHTHTCYTSNRHTRHPWGYGCGKCPACGLRARGWDKWQTARS